MSDQADLLAVLRRSEERLRSIVESAVDGIIVIDSRGIVQSLNPGAERLFRYRADEVLGRNVNMLMPSPDREEHDKYIDVLRYERRRRQCLKKSSPACG
jgi:PAS domain S-box-containing protein